MTTYIYMNEQIREEIPARPVIVVQSLSRSADPVREANHFDIWVDGRRIGAVKFDATGLPAVETHEVKAWVEFDDSVVLSASTPTAVAKVPNEPVTVPVIDFKLRFAKPAKK